MNGSKLKYSNTDNSSIKSVYTKTSYSSKYLNDLLIDVIQTLNAMKNIIAKYEKPQNLQPLEYKQSKEYIGHEIQSKPLTNLLKSKFDSPILEKLFYETNEQSNEETIIDIKNEVNEVNNKKVEPLIKPKNGVDMEIDPTIKINDEVNMVITLIKSIFRKIDDPDYICENTTCQLLRSRQKKPINNRESLIDTNRSISDNNDDHKQKFSNQKPSRRSNSLIKNLKFNPKCKEIPKGQARCTCSPIEDYYKNEGCSYINYHGRILVINCPND